VNETVAYQWVNGGFLGSGRGMGRLARGKRVRSSDIAEFKAKYVVGADMAAKLGSKGAAYGSQHLMFLGVRPISGPTVDGCVRYLFRRSDVEAAHLRKVTRTNRRAAGWEGGKKREAIIMADRVGQSAARVLGLPLSKRWNTWSNADGTIVKVAVARRLGSTGAYYFDLQPTAVAPLAAANPGYVAFGFIGLRRFLLVPWGDVAELLAGRDEASSNAPSRSRWFAIEVDGQGNMNPFGGYGHPLFIPRTPSR
jgi:hypothetical protein